MSTDDLARWMAQIDVRLGRIEANLRVIRECVQAHVTRLAAVEAVRLTPVPAAEEGSWSDD